MNTTGHYSNFVDKLNLAAEPLDFLVSSLRKKMDNADDEEYEEIEQRINELQEQIKAIKCQTAGIPAGDWPALESALWGDRMSPYYHLVWGHGPYDDLGLGN